MRWPSAHSNQRGIAIQLLPLCDLTYICATGQRKLIALPRTFGRKI
jgi:hypothetical protein